MSLFQNSRRAVHWCWYQWGTFLGPSGACEVRLDQYRDLNWVFILCQYDKLGSDRICYMLRHTYLEFTEKIPSITFPSPVKSQPYATFLPSLIFGCVSLLAILNTTGKLLLIQNIIFACQNKHKWSFCLH